MSGTPSSASCLMAVLRFPVAINGGVIAAPGAPPSLSLSLAALHQIAGTHEEHALTSRPVASNLSDPLPDDDRMGAGLERDSVLRQPAVADVELPAGGLGPCHRRVIGPRGPSASSVPAVTPDEVQISCRARRCGRQGPRRRDSERRETRTRRPVGPSPSSVQSARTGEGERADTR